jgi:hypothetical protein
MAAMPRASRLRSRPAREDEEEDTEEDYMSAAVLTQAEQQDRATAAARKRRREAGQPAPPPPPRPQEAARAKLEEGLSTALSADNKGFAMLAKMGYTYAHTRHAVPRGGEH